MSAKRRSLNELVEQGRVQSVVPTSALLDPSTLILPPEAAEGEQAHDASERAMGGGEGERHAEQTGDHGASVETSPAEAGGAELAVLEPTTLRERVLDVSATSQQGEEIEVGLDSVLQRLPEEHDVLRTGVRRGARPVRDVTYELPAATYFALNRLKNDLSRAGDRRVTVPAVVEAALSCVPSSAEDVLVLLRAYDTAGLLRSGPQRRLSARIGEERYQSLQDIGLDLYEQTGERIPGSEIWTLAIVLLLERAGRWPLD